MITDELIEEYMDIEEASIRIAYEEQVERRGWSSNLDETNFYPMINVICEPPTVGNNPQYEIFPTICPEWPTDAEEKRALIARSIVKAKKTRPEAEIIAMVFIAESWRAAIKEEAREEMEKKLRSGEVEGVRDIQGREEVLVITFTEIDTRVEKENARSQLRSIKIIRDDAGRPRLGATTKDNIRKKDVGGIIVDGGNIAEILSKITQN